MKMAIAIIIILTSLTGAGYLAYEFMRTAPPGPSPTTTPTPTPATATSTVAPLSPLEQSQQLVVSTEELIQGRILTATSTESENSNKILFLHGPQSVAKYFYQTGSEDSALTYHFYYDSSAKLRAAIIKGGASNGSKLHHAIYFDTDGTTRLSEEQLYETEVHYSWPKTWPENLLVRDPYADFTR